MRVVCRACGRSGVVATSGGRVFCGACRVGRVVIEAPLFAAVATTYAKTRDGYPWVDWREARNVSAEEREEAPWVFVDGASSGSYAAVVLERDGSVVDHVRHGPPEKTRNVSSELMAVALGLKNVEPGDGGVVNVVADFLGTACWFSGRWALKCEHTFLRLSLIARVVEERGLVVRFVHTKGHLRDDSDITRYNNRADRLCSDRKAT